MSERPRWSRDPMLTGAHGPAPGPLERERTVEELQATIGAFFKAAAAALGAAAIVAVALYLFLS